MNMLKSLSHFVLASIAAAVVTATPATAQDSPWSSYAAKFMCNAQNANDIVAVFGLYRTVVNIHNPHYLHDMLDLPVQVLICFCRSPFVQHLYSQPSISHIKFFIRMCTCLI